MKDKTKKDTTVSPRKGFYIPRIVLVASSCFLISSALDGRLSAYYKKHFVNSEKRDSTFGTKKIYEHSRSNFRNLNNNSNQLNPNSDSYWRSRGYDNRPTNWRQLIDGVEAQHNLDNRSNQLNPNNDAYWQSRGHDERPDNWQQESSSSSAAMDNHANQMNPNNEAYSASRGGKN